MQEMVIRCESQTWLQLAPYLTSFIVKKWNIRFAVVKAGDDELVPQGVELAPPSGVGGCSMVHGHSPLQANEYIK